MQERIQKILSARGICSRRKAEEYIQSGLVYVNGEIATLGQKADPETDVITVDGVVLAQKAKQLYYLMHKPVGVETSNIPSRDPGTPTVYDVLPKRLRGVVHPVGRLDKDSSGLLLFTNDGVLSYRLTHPSFYHEKEYAVSVEKPMPDGVLDKLRNGLNILGKKTKPARVTRINARRFHIALTEGRNRQIRRMCQKVGFPVKTLQRVRIATVDDAALEPGRVRALSKKEKVDLLRAVGIED